MSGWLIKTQQMRIEDLERYIDRLESELKELRRQNVQLKIAQELAAK